MTKLWGDEAGQATKTDRILVLGATDVGRRRALAGAGNDIDWTWPPSGLAPRHLNCRHAADVPPLGPGRHGSAGPDEEPRPRAG